MRRDSGAAVPRRCRVCGCTDENCSRCIERTGKPCHWVEDDLCSACAGVGRVIFVRYSSGTHIAKCEGKTASCTAGRKMAAEAVARKVMGARPFKITRMGTDCAWSLEEIPVQDYTGTEITRRLIAAEAGAKKIVTASLRRMNRR